MPPLGQGNRSVRTERTLRRKRRRSTPVSRAHAQERYYASQGRQIHTQAHRQRSAAARRPKSIAFRPLPKNNAPFKVQRQRARRRAKRANNRIPDSTAIPHIPLLSHYSERQRTIIRKTYKAAARRAGTTPTGLYLLGSQRQRQQIRRVVDRVHESEKPVEAFRRIEYHSPSKAKGLDLAGAQLSGFLGTAGVNLKAPNEGSFANALKLTKPFQAIGVGAYNIGRATVEDPEAVARSSFRTAKESIAGIFQGVKMMVEDPEGALNAMVKDYERRYGSILSNPKKFREMVKNDYGVTPFALDAVAGAGGVGRTAGVVARTGQFAKLTRLPGKAGQAARIIHEASRTERARPRLRFSAGEEGTRAQSVSRNLFVAGVQRGLDRRRATHYRRQIRKAGFIEEPHGRLLRAPGRKALPDRIPGLRPGRGEVVGRGLRDVGPWRHLTGRIQRDIGQTKSTTRLRMLTHRGRVVREMSKATDHLTKAEKVGVAFMLKYGVRSGRQSLDVLRKRLEQITTREAKRARHQGAFDSQEVEQLQKILANPDTYLSGRARGAADELKAIQAREVAKDPSLADDQELVRRLSQQAEMLDVPRTLHNGEKAPNVAEMDRATAMAEDLAAQQRKTGYYKVQGKTIHIQKIANGLRDAAEKIRKGEDPDVAPVGKLEKVKDVQDFASRVRKAAGKANLDEPAYWMSTAEHAGGARLAAVGSGLKATERNREYTGGLFRIGAEDVGLETYVKGVERNIKRRFQWQMVARNIETHAYEWSRKDGQGMTFKQIAAEMRKRRIDPDTVDMIPATIVRKREASEAGLMRGRPVDEIPQGTEFQDAHQAIRQRLTFQQLEHDDVQSAPQFRYFAVPKDVGDTLEAATKPSSGVARSLEIILKQKPTRIMLGALNVPWLGFQVASNALLTGLGGGLKPWDIYGAHKWFRGLDPEAREAVEAELGITHGHHFALDQPHLGEAKMPFGIRHLSNFYRGYKRTKVGRGLHKANPLDMMFKADEAQNNFFRKTLFYSKAKRTLYGKMGSEWKAIDRAQQSIIDKVFHLPPDEQIVALAKNADLFERHAKHVRDWLGDYTRFSNAERKLLSANVLFYGYLRFSLRFAFYTMPVEHPIMADIMSNIGRLGAQDVKQLFGVPSNYSLPTSMVSQVYFGSARDAKQGTLESLNLGRMNPFLNAVTQMESMKQGAGLVSPIYQALLDQAFEMSSFTGRQWRIEGKPTPGEAERPRNYFGSPMSLLNPGDYAIPGVSEGKPRNRILQESLMSMAFPYRTAETTGIPGTNVKPLEPSQSDDALLWSPRPMRYADEQAMSGVKRTRRAQAGKKDLALLLQSLAVQPRITAAPQVIKREREKEAAQRKRRKKGRRRGSGGFSGGGFSGGGFSGGGYGGGGFK
jgi:uncharacterized membrane protein YgcG